MFPHVCGGIMIKQEFSRVTCKKVKLLILARMTRHVWQPYLHSGPNTKKTEIIRTKTIVHAWEKIEESSKRVPIHLSFIPVY